MSSVSAIPLSAPPPAAEEHRRLGAMIPALLSAGLALALYAVTLGGTYVFDDQQIVLRDPRVRDPAHFGEIWTKDYFNGGVDNLYRPLITLSYAVQWRLHGNVPWAFHLVNWLLHAAASAAVAELARRLARGSARVGLIAGLLFAAHPVHVEVVANIVGRAESACTLAIVSCLILFLARPMTNARAIAIAACALVAIGCKEQGLLLPLMLLALYPVRQRLFPPPALSAESPSGAPVERNALLLIVLLLSWLVAGNIVLREEVLHLKFWWDRYFLDYTQNPLVLSRGLDRWLMPLALLGRYAMLLLNPWRLSPDYGGVTIGSHLRLDDPFFWIGIAAALAWCLAMAIAVLRRAWASAFCLFAFATTYGLVGNTVTTIGTIFGDRLMYLPSAFFLILIALGLARLRARPLIGAMILLLALASLRTVTYAERWNRPIALYEQALKEKPGSIQLYIVLAEELSRQGRLEEAAEWLARGRRVMPDYAGIWYKSAVNALQQGKFDEAKSFAWRAHDLDPRFTNNNIWTYINERRIPRQTRPLDDAD